MKPSLHISPDISFGKTISILSLNEQNSKVRSWCHLFIFSFLPNDDVTIDFERKENRRIRIYHFFILVSIINKQANSGILWQHMINKKHLRLLYTLVWFNCKKKKKKKDEILFNTKQQSSIVCSPSVSLIFNKPFL